MLLRFVLFCSLVGVSSLYAVTESVPQQLDVFIEKQYSLPQYQKDGYSPLGRSPVVDALLGDPFYMPVYADTVARVLKGTAETNSLYAMSKAAFIAGGISFREMREEVLCSAPVEFIRVFGNEGGTRLYTHWKHFLDISDEVTATLGVLSADEKEWLRKNYNNFFFGSSAKNAEYEFFTTNDVMPLKFFEMASRVNLSQLADCAARLGGIADDVFRNWDQLTLISLPQDFSWTENGRTLLVSAQEHVVHSSNADFFIDIGGNNTIQTNAGGTEGLRPAALHIDFFGGNTYVGDTFVQGSGFLGVGVLASSSGNNTYKAKNYSQGCGFFGVGLLWNLGANNRYEIDFGGQSFAAFGSALLWNKGGNNIFVATQGMSQGAASTLGVAFFVNNGGKMNIPLDR